jgi:thioredoxin reductase (NADPH)
MQVFDTIIIGGGPAGLSAALHLAFHRRDVLVLDRRTGPLWYTLTPLWNVPGFVGESGVAIQKAMQQEAIQAGAKVQAGNVTRITGSVGAFVIETDKHETHHAKTVLLATGVARYHPLVDGDFEPWLKYAAKGNTYYCPDCEAPELTGRDLVVIGVGGANSAVSEAIPLMEFAARTRLLLTGGTEFKPEWEEKRQKLDLEVIRGQIASVDGSKGIVKAVILEDGTRVESDAWYVSSPKEPRNDLAKQLGLEIGPKGHILTLPRGQARLAGQGDDAWCEGVWAAGDVQPQTQQVSIAAGAGNRAAVMIDQFLNKREPRRLGLEPGARFEPPVKHEARKLETRTPSSTQNS